MKLSPHERGLVINYNQGACIKGPLSRLQHPLITRAPCCSVLTPCRQAGLPLQIIAGYRSIWTPHDVPPVTKGPSQSIIGNNGSGALETWLLISEQIKIHIKTKAGPLLGPNCRKLAPGRSRGRIIPLSSPSVDILGNPW